MSDFIGIDIQGDDLKNFQNFLAKYPEEAQAMISDDVNAYLLKVVGEYPSPNYITRTAAYGAPFFTERQRRWFFAALKSGTISVPYHRTQGLREAWRKEGTGTNAILVNESPGAPFVMGDNTQSRHEKLVGWKTIGTIIQERTSRIVQIANAAAKKAIKKLHMKPE